jgi:hypothetical protein
MGLRVPDYWTVVRVGALVEDPAVQQHVFRLVDGQVDGIAGHGRESLIAAGEMMRWVKPGGDDEPPQGKPFEVPLEPLAEGGVVDGLLVAEAEEAVVDLLLDVGEASAAIRSSRGGQELSPTPSSRPPSPSSIRGAAYGASIATCSACRVERGGGRGGDEVEREGDGDGEMGGGIRGDGLAESRSLVFIEGWREQAVGGWGGDHLPAGNARRRRRLGCSRSWGSAGEVGSLSDSETKDGGSRCGVDDRTVAGLERSASTGDGTDESAQ